MGRFITFVHASLNWFFGAGRFAALKDKEVPSDLEKAQIFLGWFRKHGLKIGLTNVVTLVESGKVTLAELELTKEQFAAILANVS